MLKSILTAVLPLLMLAGHAFAVGCSTHSFTACDDNIVHWFDPDTGEVCDPLDCGGGRAPPKTDEPGCPGYTGTKVRTTSYLSCFTPSSALATATTAKSTSIEPTAESTTSNATTKDTSTVSSTTTDSATGTEASGSGTTPATTAAATLLSGAPSSSTAIHGTASTSGSAAPAATTNAGDALTGSLVAVAGAALGAFALL